MEKQELLSEILMDLRSINRTLHERHHRKAGEKGLTLEQYHLLLRVRKREQSEEGKGISIGELAGLFNNASNTMSEKLTRLENKGLVIKKKDSVDRRITRVYMTEEGSILLSKIHDSVIDDSIQSLFVKLDSDEVDNLKKALQTVRNVLEV